MITFIFGTVLPMALAGVATHIAKTFYDERVRPLLKPDSNVQQPEEEPKVVSEEPVVLSGFRRTGNGYTAIFK